ncbi:hypothetical protein LCGC14_2100500, partial [marine sediment metagenome]
TWISGLILLVEAQERVTSDNLVRQTLVRTQQNTSVFITFTTRTSTRAFRTGPPRAGLVHAQGGAT